jgi:uncharacterized membrane protein YphA (DoxX/SURF4 family)
MSVPERLRGNAPAATWVVRLAIAAVFVSEGIQKFVFPAALGVGRFTKIGIPMSAVMAPSSGSPKLAAACSSPSGCSRASPRSRS